MSIDFATRGPPGADGNGFLWFRRDPTAADGRFGDTAMNVNTTLVFIKDESGVWQPQFEMRGKRGTSGLPGPQGFGYLSGTTVPASALGRDGDFYIRDTTAGPVIYGPKAAGQWPDGEPLVPVLLGAGAPGPSVGFDGQSYLDYQNAVLYGAKTGGAWPAGTTLRGLLAGSGAPNTTTGFDGQYYVDAVAQVMYGPKAGGVWPAGLSFRGTPSLKPIEPWATATAYVVGPPASFVSFGGSAYQCVAAHTSGVFTADLAAVRWEIVAFAAMIAGQGAPNTDEGVDGQIYVDAQNQLLYGPKTAGNWGPGAGLTGAAKGANSDITSLSGLTTALSEEQGGTNSSSLGAGLIPATGTTLRRSFSDRAADVLNALEYATTLAQRTAIRSGNTGLDAIWGDLVDDASSPSRDLRSLRLPGGNYEVADSQALSLLGVPVIGEPGMTTIRKNGANSLFRAWGAGPNLGAALALSADAAESATAISISGSPSGVFTANSWAILTDTSRIDPRLYGQKAEFVRIRSVSGSTVNLWSPLKFAYTVAQTAKLVPVGLLVGVGLRDVAISMSGAAAPTSSGTFQELFAVDARWCLAADLSGLRIRDSALSAVHLVGCIGTRISDYGALDLGSSTLGTADPTSVDGTPGFGYAIAENGLNLGLIARGLYIERARHGYTTLSGSDQFPLGVPMGSLIADGVHIDAKNAAWDTHQGGHKITFDALKAIGGKFQGFQIRSPLTMLRGCSSEGVLGPALWMRGGAATLGGNAGNGCTVTDFRSDGSNWLNDVGINAAAGLDWRNYGAVIDDGWDNEIDATVQRCGGPALTIGGIAQSQGGRYDIKTVSPCQTSLVKTTAVDSLNTGNTDIRIESLDVKSTDGKVIDLVTRSSVATVMLIENAKGTGHAGRTVNGVLGDTNLTVVNDDAARLVKDGPRLYDDFTGAALDNIWRALKGSATGSLVPAIFPVVNGCVRLVMGIDAAGTVATNGSRLDSQIVWQPSKGGLVAALCLRMSVTDTVMFAGLTDAIGAITIPFSVAAGADTVTASVPNAVGFFYDPLALTPQWHLVAVNASGAAQRIASGVAPSPSVIVRLAVELSAAGAATFLINGAVVGSIPAAVLASGLYSPVVVGFNRSTTTVRNIDVDFIDVRQKR